ncbi:MAG: efflux RND transporter periplasmic adaptor subunit [Planctomycetes bacterium]|nr:efflux RND transporter periplasmic adaptor subunit [Planctomycetota bacterium]
MARPSDHDGEHPPQAWRSLRFLAALAVTAVAMLFVGARYGDRIGAFFGELWRDATGAEATASSPRDAGYFTCGMHPWVILPAPGLCPICHMDLTPLDPSKFTGEVAIDPVVAQNIGVRTALVTTGPLAATVRTVGKVDYDETSLHDVDLRVAGWIEQLHVDFLGARVERGQPLFELYSPELFQAQQDYLLALRQKELPKVAFVPRVGEDAMSTLESARTRLSYYGIGEAQIAALERRGVADRTMTITSPAAGTIVDKRAVAGMRVDPGMRTYRIADLSTVWVTATAYEYQLPFLELGQQATMTLTYVPGQKFAGRVTYVYPWTDEKTREVNVRLEFDNPQGLLKPGMFVNIELHRTLAQERTLVDRAAVIDTGERRVAIVSLGNGRFEPRTLRTGIETDGGKVEVLDGLVPGERVVTSAQFLLDSEARIREGLGRMLRGDLVGVQENTVPGPELTSLPPDLAAAAQRALAAYLRIGDELASDSAAKLAEPARELAAGIDAMVAIEPPGQEHFWHDHDEAATVRGKALELAAATDLTAARLLFADTSIAFGKLLRATGVPSSTEQEIEELHCPMFLENQGGSSWLQRAGDVRNPYFGSRMLECFDERRALPVAGTGAGDATATLGAADTAAVDAIVTAYLQAAAELAGDRSDDLGAIYARLRAAADSLGSGRAPAPVANAARAVADAVPTAMTDIEAARATFGPLSAAMLGLLRLTPANRPLVRAYCPMVEASWLQPGDEVENPYMGSRMLRCGSIEERLPAREGATGR